MHNISFDSMALKLYDQHNINNRYTNSHNDRGNDTSCIKYFLKIYC